MLEAMEALQAYSTVSLDAPAEDDRTRLERFGGPGRGAGPARLLDEPGPVRRDLPPRERRLLYLRFFQDKTQAEIATTLGISQMHVSRLLSTTLQQLRDKGRGAGRLNDGPGHSNGSTGGWRPRR